MKVTKRNIIKLVVEHNRGFIEGNEPNGVEQNFFRLIINAIPTYDYSNWTRNDLKDLADAIYEFLKII